MFRVCFRMSAIAKQAAQVEPTNNYVLHESHKGLSKVTLNNPKRLNCVNLEMVN